MYASHPARSDALTPAEFDVNITAMINIIRLIEVIMVFIFVFLVGSKIQIK